MEPRRAEPLAVPDSERGGLIARLPAAARPYALLARFDRPIGAWLLFWPGAWAIVLAGAWAMPALRLIALFAIGAVAMRGAGCVYNDIIDRDLDTRVARTRDRPLASRRVTLRAAWRFLFGLCGIGLLVLAWLDTAARIAAIASLGPVACYPFMKRLTWWPQAWLGVVFSWGALVGWAAVTGGFAPAALWLYAGAIFWVIGYDTIYALQDIEDDALAGVKSSARALGRHVRGGVAACYAIALALWGVSFWMRRPDMLSPLALLPVAIHLGWQVWTLRPGDAANALARFRSNRDCGLLMLFAALAVGSAGFAV